MNYSTLLLKPITGELQRAAAYIVTQKMECETHSPCTPFCSDLCMAYAKGTITVGRHFYIAAQPLAGSYNNVYPIHQHYFALDEFNGRRFSVKGEWQITTQTKFWECTLITLLTTPLHHMMLSAQEY